MNVPRKIYEILTPSERRRGGLVLLIVVGLAAVETVGVASVMPFLAVLGNPGMIETNAVLALLYRELGMESVDGFLIVLGVSALMLIFLSAIYRTLTEFAMNDFIEMRRHGLAKRLLETYLRHPYAFFLSRHSGELSKISSRKWTS